MKERLTQLLDMEQLTPSKFADLIGVQRSSVSHVISERNKPSFDFLQKTLKAFPGLNADWLILGEGTMYEQMGRTVSGNLFDPLERPVEAAFPEDIPVIDHDREEIDNIQASFEEHNPIKETDSTPDETDSDRNEQDSILKEPGVGISEGGSDFGSSRKVVLVMVLYDDDTFKSFKPSQ